MSSCTSAPSAKEMSLQEEVATAKLKTVEEVPDAIGIEKKDVVQPEKEEPKLVVENDEPQLNKKAIQSETQTSINKETAVKSALKTTPVVAKTYANISFDKLVHEFGEIDEGDKITHKFKFKNTGNGPLIINNVDVSCGCTMPTYPIIPIGPGETGEIGVIYNSKGKFGTQKPSITVNTNASQPLVKLYMSGSIKHVFEKTKADTTDTQG